MPDHTSVDQTSSDPVPDSAGPPGSIPARSWILTIIRVFLLVEVLAWAGLFFGLGTTGIAGVMCLAAAISAFGTLLESLRTGLAAIGLGVACCWLVLPLFLFLFYTSGVSEVVFRAVVVIRVTGMLLTLLFLHQVPRSSAS